MVALGAPVSDWATMEELYSAEDMYFCQTQETLDCFMTEAPDDIGASLTILGYQWEMADCAVIVQVFIILFLLDRIMQSFKERLSVWGDKKATSSSSALAIMKCNTLIKFHPGLKEDENSEVADDPNVPKPAIRNIICIIVRHGTKKKTQCSDQEQPVSETARKIQAMHQKQKAIDIQVQEAKTSLKLLPATEKRLRFSIMNSMACVKAQVLSLPNDCLKIREMAPSVEGKDMGENLESGETGNRDHVDEPAKGSREKLRCAVTSSVLLNIQDIKKKKFYNNIAKEKKKAPLAGQHKCAQNKEASIKRADKHLKEKENEMTMSYHPKEMEQLAILPVKKDLDLQKKVGSFEANGLMSLETEEQEIYQKRFQDLELRLERIISSYQWQILTLEGKALDDWLRAQEAERNLIIVRQEVADLRQRIRERAIQLQLLELNSHVFIDASGAFGQDNCLSDLCAQDGASSEMGGSLPTS